jgi:hypothetical protein
LPEQTVQASGVLEVLLAAQVQFVGNPELQGADGCRPLADVGVDGVRQRRPVGLVARELHLQMWRDPTIRGDPDVRPRREIAVRFIERHRRAPVAVRFQHPDDTVDSLLGEAFDQHADVVGGSGPTGQNRDVAGNEHVLDVQLREEL